MTIEPSISPGVWRIDTAPPGALILSEAAVVARNNGGNVTLDQLATDMRVTEKRAHEIVSTLIDTDAWTVTGQTATGQPKFGPRR